MTVPGLEPTAQKAFASDSVEDENSSTKLMPAYQSTAIFLIFKPFKDSNPTYFGTYCFVLVEYIFCHF